MVFKMDKKILNHYIKYFNNQNGRCYPCSNQIVICGVIIKDKNKALSVMESKGAVIKCNGNNTVEWELNNERWLWKNWNTNYRGYRFYKVIIDENISERMFHWAVAYCGSYCCSMEVAL